MAQFSAPQANFTKKWGKRATKIVSRFFESFDQKIAFFRRALTSKLVYIGVKGALRKILGSGSQKWMS